MSLNRIDIRVVKGNFIAGEMIFWEVRALKTRSIKYNRLSISFCIQLFCKVNAMWKKALSQYLDNQVAFTSSKVLRKTFGTDFQIFSAQILIFFFTNLGTLHKK